MKDVLLVNLPPGGIYNSLREDSVKKLTYGEPLGLLYLASYARSQGHSVDIYDPIMHGGNTLDHALKTIDVEKPKVIGIPTYSVMMPQVKKFCDDIRLVSDSIIVLGGPHSSFLQQESLHDTRAHMVVRGEGEISLAEIINSYDNPNALKSIRGTSSLFNGQFTSNPDRERIENLDSLAFPARDLLSPEYYNSHVNVVTSRGCPFKCIYCVSPALWKSKVGFRSIDSVKLELDDFFQDREPSPDFYINFTDDTFSIGGEQRNIDMAKMLGEYNVPWNCYVRAGTANQATFDAFKDNTCDTVRFGIESGTEKMLDLYKRNLSKKTIIESLEKAKKAGLSTQGSFIIGSPTETEDDVKQTIQFAQNLPLDFAFFFLSTPYPGTELTTRFRPDGTVLDAHKFTPHSFGNYDSITPERKIELMEEAYYEFYIRHKGFPISDRFNQLEASQDRLAELQNIIFENK